MAIVLEIPVELENAIRAEAERDGVSVETRVVQALQASFQSPPVANRGRFRLAVAPEGVRMPHQTEAWWDNIRDLAYDEQP